MRRSDLLTYLVAYGHPLYLRKSVNLLDLWNKKLSETKTHLFQRQIFSSDCIYIIVQFDALSIISISATSKTLEIYLSF